MLVNRIDGNFHMSLWTGFYKKILPSYAYYIFTHTYIIYNLYMLKNIVHVAHECLYCTSYIRTYIHTYIIYAYIHEGNHTLMALKQ
jgi:hypothetical protein